MQNRWQPGQLEKFPLHDLPVATYLVAGNGRIIEGNRRLREMLQLPAEGPLATYSLEDFYHDPAQRLALLRSAEEASKTGRSLEKATAIFKIGSKVRRLHVYCGLVQSADNEIRFLGCLVDVAEEEALKELLDHLPAGLFQIAEGGELTHANQALAKLLGYENPSEILGRRFADFLAEPSDLLEIQKSLSEHPVVTRERLELKRGDETLFSTLSAAALPTAGSILGTLRDVTDREVLRELLDRAPIGVYKVLYQGRQHKIIECNTTFAEMFDFAGPSDVKGRDIRELHRDSIAYENFLGALRESDEKKQTLSDYVVTTTLHSNRSVTFSVNARLIRDPRTGQEIGRFGVLSDVTRKVKGDQAVDLIKRDVGNFLHEYDKLLSALNSSLPSIRRSLYLALERRSQENEDLANLLEKLAVRLLHGIEQDFLPLAEIPERNEALPAATWRRARKTIEMVRRTTQNPRFADFNIASYHGAANVLGAVLEEALQSQRLQRDRVKDLLRLAVQVSAIGAVLIVDKIAKNIGDTLQGSRALRDYLTWGTRASEAPQLMSVDSLLDQALRQVSDYAHLSKVTFRLPPTVRGLKVFAIERDLVRALSNVLHNAIKYSWAHDADGSSWVTLKAGREGSHVTLEVENYGVPITAEEVTMGLLFELGARGSLARDRGRAGTGIGLTDAKAAITQSRGRISIDSRPATSSGPPDDYTKPFLTTVRIELPSA
jgi:PAS domain S-box-containing protein